jgi:Pentapeptide repeats (8 copies)
MPLQTIALPTGSAIAAIAALAAAAALAVWLIPRRQRSRWERSGLGDKDVAELENSARATLVQLFGGLALILTFAATWLQLSDAREASDRTREASDRTLRLAAERQENERFAQAVEQLGSAKLDVRVGGIYGLKQAAHDTPSRRETVAQLLVAYLKTHHPTRNDDWRVREMERLIKIDPTFSPCASSVAPPVPDTQAALSVLLGMPRAVRPQVDLSNVDLVGVRIKGADFSGAILRHASLAGAKLSGANFDHAQIPSGTDLRGACLSNARFNGTYIGFVQAAGTDLSGADLSNAFGFTSSLVGTSSSVGAKTDECTRLPEARDVPAHCNPP